eukprot:scaffold68717_cov69-Phaeocystis_antarctica.AAC.8
MNIGKSSGESVLREVPQRPMPRRFAGTQRRAADRVKSARAVTLSPSVSNARRYSDQPIAANRPACSGGGRRLLMSSTGSSDATASSAAAIRLQRILPARTVASTTPGAALVPTAPATIIANLERNGSTSNEGDRRTTPSFILFVLATTACMMTKPIKQC